MNATENIKGVDVPKLGLGTYRLTGAECERAVETALGLGYRHIDTARMYGNEREVGRAIEASGVAREEVFLVTKIWPDDFARDRAPAAARDSLEKLGTDYIDLLLLHWPSRSVPVGETLGALRELLEEGSVKHLGVSNFTPEGVREAEEHAEVFSNQVEYSPYHDQSAVLEQAREMDYLVTAYTPTGRGKVRRDATLGEISAAHDATPTQVALAWLVRQEKVAAIPKATSEEHLNENLAALDLSLSEKEVQRISALSR
ncbi:Aldo/keto reductases related to diketogulonate reductase [Rubrobacter radiotolerans]|uniref:Aldo/keto reductase n=1 Tax=Rubrobacter radiotolerans TaxID=42256 RepID=A0A023X5I7_RUBRA|nr:aldo/keto reductase [Rubrobacter radiotolerans]AHY47471.1 Aldo/keto reductases related to diketogulonate reductase [Rubrobacter radiotolerans]MDX5894875.1 aldo/keto reductase [Rubrobacter radiotolerans]SMC06966.1 Aldo/keto reductase [Rubrobacter radiotolerans DSM 5868]